MKKLTILSVAVLALSFASCKKDRVCTCNDTTTTTTSAGSSTTTDTDVRTLTKVSKKAGRVNCLSTKSTNTYDLGSGSVTSVSERHCTLS